TLVSTMIGTPLRVLASRPSVASYVSACWRAHSDALGSYSPVNGMRILLVLDFLQQSTPARPARDAPVDEWRSLSVAIPSVRPHDPTPPPLRALGTSCRRPPLDLP